MARAESRTWRTRLLVGVVLGAATFAGASLLDWDPQPVPFVVMMAVVMSLVWMVLDVVDDEPARWLPATSPVRDRTDEATADLRLLTSHQQASVPTEAVRERLVALARGRDPDLADALRHELGGPHDPARRLSPADVDRILTRIEAARDRP
jgi:hypothetical protein